MCSIYNNFNALYLEHNKPLKHKQERKERKKDKKRKKEIPWCCKKLGVSFICILSLSLSLSLSPSLSLSLWTKMIDLHFTFSLSCSWTLFKFCLFSFYIFKLYFVTINNNDVVIKRLHQIYFYSHSCLNRMFLIIGQNRCYVSYFILENFE